MKILGSGVLIKIIAPANHTEAMKAIRARFAKSSAGDALVMGDDSVTLGKGIILQLGEELTHAEDLPEFSDELVERVAADVEMPESIDALGLKSAMGGVMKEMMEAISGRAKLPNLHVGDTVFFHLAAADAVPDTDNQYLLSARCINAVEEAE